jgi:hypothetical protein
VFRGPSGGQFRARITVPEPPLDPCEPSPSCRKSAAAPEGHPAGITVDERFRAGPVESPYPAFRAMSRRIRVCEVIRVRMFCAPMGPEGASKTRMPNRPRRFVHGEPTLNRMAGTCTREPRAREVALRVFCVIDVCAAVLLFVLR